MALACLLLALPTHAADPDKQKAPGVALDLSIPQSPAFTVLGVNPEEVVRPGNPRDLAVKLLEGFDRQGNFQNALAIDVGPYWLAEGRRLDLAQYRTKPYLIHVLGRTTISLGTTKGTSEDDKSARAAIGFHSTLFTVSDPRLDRARDRAFISARDAAEGIPIPLEPNKNDFVGKPLEYAQALQAWEKATKERLEKMQSTFNKLYEEGLEKLRHEQWNDSAVVLAGAPSWISQKGKLDGLESNGGGVWLSGAYGFEKSRSLKNSLQLVGHVRYRAAELLPDPDNKGKFFEQDSWIFGGGVRVGSENFNTLIQGARVVTDPVGKADDRFWRVTLAIDWRIGKERWITISGGRDLGNNVDNGTSFLASLKFGLSKESKISPF